MAAGSRKQFRSEGCLRLSAPAGESALSLAWNNSRNVQISIHLFTPGGVQGCRCFSVLSPPSASIRTASVNGRGNTCPVYLGFVAATSLLLLSNRIS